MEIAKSQTKLQAKEVELTLKKKKEEKLKIAEFRNNEKNIEIDRENKKLLSKLVEISSGKLCTVKKEKDPNVPGPKSLNLGYRKRETERIEQENHAFAKRLFDKQANLSKRKLEEDFKNHLKYKK